MYVLLGEIGNAFAYFVFTSQMPYYLVYIYLNRVYFDGKTKLCLIVPGRQGKYIFAQESFYLQGILDDINEQDISFLDCKHKHIMKSGAPPDKFGVLYCIVTYVLLGEIGNAFAYFVFTSQMPYYLVYISKQSIF